MRGVRRRRRFPIPFAVPDVPPLQRRFNDVEYVGTALVADLLSGDGPYMSVADEWVLERTIIEERQRARAAAELAKREALFRAKFPEVEAQSLPPS